MHPAKSRFSATVLSRSSMAPSDLLELFWQIENVNCTVPTRVKWRYATDFKEIEEFIIYFLDPSLDNSPISLWEKIINIVSIKKEKIEIFSCRIL